jgi:signal transduction histidine kinase
VSAEDAHDFRNILLVIRGYTACLRSSLADPKQLEDLDEIERAAERGAALVNQMAASARQAAA